MKKLEELLEGHKKRNKELLDRVLFLEKNLDILSKRAHSKASNYDEIARGNSFNPRDNIMLETNLESLNLNRNLDGKGNSKDLEIQALQKEKELYKVILHIKRKFF